MSSPDPILTVIMISYNTAQMTLAAIRTCLETTRETPIRLVVLDNASTDGSADAIAEAFPPEVFPQVELIRSDENLGFARANNVVAEAAKTDWLLLLNPDTECHEVEGRGAVDALVGFASETMASHAAGPQAAQSPGIWGGRTVFPDGRLNPASCYGRITLWSMICRATGLYRRFPSSELFNPEDMGNWPRDTVREVDIVVGCFLLIRKDLWDRLGGFDLKYFMYGEDADLCLRARAMGYGSMITPKAEIMHIYGASTTLRSDKIIAVARARATLIRDHWPAWQAPIGLGLMWAGMAVRRVTSLILGRLAGGRQQEQAQVFRAGWAARGIWWAGY